MRLDLDLGTRLRVATDAGFSLDRVERSEAGERHLAGGDEMLGDQLNG